MKMPHCTYCPRASRAAGQEATNTTARTPAPRQPKPDGILTPECTI